MTREDWQELANNSLYGSMGGFFLGGMIGVRDAAEAFKREHHDTRFFNHVRCKRKKPKERMKKKKKREREKESMNEKMKEREKERKKERPRGRRKTEAQSRDWEVRKHARREKTG